jgi:hypothetical protein
MLRVTHFIVVDPLIEMPKRFAVLRLPSGLRPVFLAMAIRFIVLASSISSRSDFIDGPRSFFSPISFAALALGHQPVQADHSAFR